MHYLYPVDKTKAEFKSQMQLFDFVKY